MQDTMINERGIIHLCKDSGHVCAVCDKAWTKTSQPWVAVLALQLIFWLTIGKALNFCKAGFPCFCLDGKNAMKS